MKGVIMAGGIGSRLRPLTNDIPKPMVPIIDRPVLYYIVNLLKNAGIKDIAMTLNYKPQKIINYFRDGREFGVNINYFIEDLPLGTAGSIKNAEEFIDGTFVVISGDAFTNIDLKSAIAYHKKKGGLLTVISKRVDDPFGFGVIKTDSQGLITEFKEKPENADSNLINTGIYICDKKVLDYIPQGFYDFGKQLLPSLIGGIYSFETDSFWSDIGTLSSYYKTNGMVAENPEKFAVEI